MKQFHCQNCGQLLYFENVRCEKCGSGQGYLAARGELLPLDGASAYTYCANQARGVCNWLVAEGAGDSLCLACGLNRTIPNLDDPVQMERWRALEGVKRRLVYSLLRLGLPVAPKPAGGGPVIAFDLLGNETTAWGAMVSPMTGHRQGVITIDTAEADPAERERRRAQMLEPYRTLAGHFRHEIGHYYWMLLFGDEQRKQDFRAVFGDERADYGMAVGQHHQQGAPPGWQRTHVSAYATAHPWEDWAETWAHLLHILDTMETASAFGVAPGERTETGFDAYWEEDFDRVIARWLPLTYAVNSLNRSMGLPDLYPFVLSGAAIEKLRFVRRAVREFAG